MKTSRNDLELKVICCCLCLDEMAANRVAATTLIGFKHIHFFKYMYITQDITSFFVRSFLLDAVSVPAPVDIHSSRD